MVCGVSEQVTGPLACGFGAKRVLLCIIPRLFHRLIASILRYHWVSSRAKGIVKFAVSFSLFIRLTTCDFDQTTVIVCLTPRNDLLGVAANQLIGLSINQELGNIDQRQILIVK